MSADSGPPVTFYRLQACPFCERVARKLNEYDVPYRSRYVEPMHSDRNVVKRVAGVRSVPVIVDENTGVTMAESANVVAYLDATYGDGGGDAEVATDGGNEVATGAGRPAGGDGDDGSVRGTDPGGGGGA